ncbi:MAG: 8-amino-7-oxononanoate synthase [Aeromicrobium sp.]|nr:8-amino-7-oxononanoate synthase [Aeromicrobium sp.]
MRLETWLADAAAARERAGLTRRLAPRGPQSELLDLAGNAYLGLCLDPRVTRAAAQAALDWGAGAGASRLVTGTLSLHTGLEDALASFTGQPAALVFSTGYHANLSVVTSLADADTLIVSDAHVHASLVDACRLAKAPRTVVRHVDLEAVEHALAGRSQSRALVLVESIYSVLGDAAPLVELAELCARHDATLLVDEAHGIGVAGRGRGLVHELGLAGLPHVLVTMTLSKALGSQGGAVLGGRAVIDHLVNCARPFIFDTALAPAATAAALEALRITVAEPALVDRVRTVAAALSDAVGISAPAGAVMSVPMSGPRATLEAQAECSRRGLRVGAFRPPSVPDGISRLRLTASAAIDDAALAHATDVLAAVTAT